MTETHKCLCCGLEFEPTCHISRQIYCSAECRTKYSNAKRYFDSERMEFCPECGNAIEKSGERGRWRRFCSDGCRVAYVYRKRREQKASRERTPQVCPNCGKEFTADFGVVRRFCCDACRLEWWREYHKAHPAGSTAVDCAECGKALTGKHIGGSYCSRECYLKAIGSKTVTVVCAWCGESFTAKASANRIYCSHPCAVAGRSAPGKRSGKRRIPATDALEWRSLLTQAAKAAERQDIEIVARLVCGTTNMYNGVDGLVSIIRYGLQQNPYDGNIYVFRDGSGSLLKYLQWDGAGFSLSKRRAQSGAYPWPTGEFGTVVDISVEEWHYLLAKSIVPTKLKKPPKKRKKKKSKSTKKSDIT